MLYFSFMALELILYQLIPWIDQYFNHLKNKFFWNTSQNDAEYQFNENILCVSMHILYFNVYWKCYLEKFINSFIH